MPPRGPTLRQVYETLGVVDDRHQRVLHLRYFDTPLGDHEVRFRSDDDLTPVFDKEFGEALSFAHLAVAAGINFTVANIESRKPPEPDILVELTDGNYVYAEIATVVAGPSARYHGTINLINTLLRRREEDDGTYAALVEGKQVSFVLPTVPRARDVGHVIEEIVNMMRSIDFTTVSRNRFIPVGISVAPILSHHEARYIVAAQDGLATYVRATSDAHAFNPDDSLGNFATVLSDKMGKTYRAAHPIWLLLVLEDLMQVPMLSLQAIRQLLPTQLGQFSRLIVGTVQDVVDVP